jgi:hypothetical protein
MAYSHETLFSCRPTSDKAGTGPNFVRRCRTIPSDDQIICRTFKYTFEITYRKFKPDDVDGDRLAVDAAPVHRVVVAEGLLQVAQHDLGFGDPGDFEVGALHLGSML